MKNVCSVNSTDSYIKNSFPLLGLTCSNTEIYATLSLLNVITLSKFHDRYLPAMKNVNSIFPHLNFYLGTSEKEKWFTTFKVFSSSIIEVLLI